MARSLPDPPVSIQNYPSKVTHTHTHTRKFLEKQKTSSCRPCEMTVIPTECTNSRSVARHRPHQLHLLYIPDLEHMQTSMLQLLTDIDYGFC